MNRFYERLEGPINPGVAVRPNGPNFNNFVGCWIESRRFKV